MESQTSDNSPDNSLAEINKEISILADGVCEIITNHDIDAIWTKKEIAVLKVIHRRFKHLQELRKQKISH